MNAFCPGGWKRKENHEILADRYRGLRVTRWFYSASVCLAPPLARARVLPIVNGIRRRDGVLVSGVFTGGDLRDQSPLVFFFLRDVLTDQHFYQFMGQ
jgi:hypothetical protein